QFPHIMNITARKTRKEPQNKQVFLQGDIQLNDIDNIEISYWLHGGWIEQDNLYHRDAWLSVTKSINEEKQALIINTHLQGTQSGHYLAKVVVNAKQAVNKKNMFLIKLATPTYPPRHKETQDFKEEIVDNEDIGFQCSSFNWLTPFNSAWKYYGYKGSYLVNGNNQNISARFTPDLAAGTYKVLFHEETPFDPAKRIATVKQKWNAPEQLVDEALNPAPKFKVRIKHKNGIEEKWMKPLQSLEIGEFEFEEGTEGYVEILTMGSTGQVIADAIKFVLQK
ncbi:MAG: hypothetical protein AAGI07_18915, partial [Bacteroidota bacterium]